MAERLTKKRVQALLEVLGYGEDYLREQIQDHLDVQDSDVQRQAKEDDETLAEALIARRILHARWIAEKPTPHFAPTPDDRLPGFD